jgi:hypothetical protein
LQIISFSFYVVTWNVGTRYPDDITLHDLLGLEGNPKNDHHAPDFFICGLVNQKTFIVPINIYILK